MPLKRDGSVPNPFGNDGGRDGSDGQHPADPVRPKPHRPPTTMRKRKARGNWMPWR